MLAVGVQLALCAIDFGTTTGFNTVIAIATEGFCAYTYDLEIIIQDPADWILDLSYALPLGARILSKLTGHHRELDGPYRLGKASMLLNVIGFVFLLFASITFNFPQGKSVSIYAARLYLKLTDNPK